MSVVVRMEMPKRCYDCDMADGLTCMAMGGVYGREVPKMIWIRRRPDWCPILCQLPEGHGDLIDASTFKKNMDYVCSSGGWLEPVTSAVTDYVKNHIDAQTVVVPAERSET